MTAPGQVMAAAVQMDARIGDVAGNIARAERLAREAFKQGASWVMLPEFFTSPVGYHQSLRSVALPAEGPALKMMLGLAREYQGVVGGSFIIAEDGDAYNRYYLAGPGGLLGSHDKDQPTMWENAYYVGGNDDGVIQTPAGPVAAAMCWELIRSRTAKRLRGKVRLVVGGSCWWSVPDWKSAAAFTRGMDAQNRRIMAETPGRFARLVGAPFIHAAHCGRFMCDTPYFPFKKFSSYYLGEAQVVAADGAILARRTFEQGEGVVLAKVDLKTVGPKEEVPERFWLPEMPAWLRLAWAYQNFHGARHYRAVKKRSGFNWQRPGWGGAEKN